MPVLDLANNTAMNELLGGGITDRQVEAFAEDAARGYLEKSADPNETIEKIARDGSIPANFVDRICELTNVKIYSSLLKTAEPSGRVNIKFPLARGRGIRESITSPTIAVKEAMDKTASDRTGSVSADFLNAPPAWLRTFSDDSLSKLAEDSGYQTFFRGMLAKDNYKSPDDIPEEKKKAFFEKVDASWKSKKESVGQTKEAFYKSEQPTTPHPKYARAYLAKIASAEQEAKGDILGYIDEIERHSRKIVKVAMGMLVTDADELREEYFDACELGLDKLARPLIEEAFRRLEKTGELPYDVKLASVAPEEYLPENFPGRVTNGMGQTVKYLKPLYQATEDLGEKRQFLQAVSHDRDRMIERVEEYSRENRA